MREIKVEKLYRFVINKIIKYKKLRDEKYYKGFKLIFCYCVLKIQIEIKLLLQGLNPWKPKKIKRNKIQQVWYEFLSKDPRK